MAFSTKLRLIKQKFEQLVGDEVILSGKTIIDGASGSIEYNGNPVFTQGNQIVNKTYVDGKTSSGITASTVYNGASPSTVTVGGISSGADLVGKTSNELLEEMLVPYINPAFTSFRINGQATTVEVGTDLEGDKTFVWGTSTSGNVKANSVEIWDITGGDPIATGLANDGSEVIDVGVLRFNTPSTRTWRANAENTKDVGFNSGNFLVTGIYPYFWGKVASGGAEGGVNRPVANQALVSSGSKVLSSSNGTITISYNSTSDDYLWFAIPVSSTSKNVWYVDALNNGAIGGAVSAGGNLFPTFDNVEVDSPTVLWEGVEYKIYISNYQSAVASAMQMRNS